jgi:hypothetical protein
MVKTTKTTKTIVYHLQSLASNASDFRAWSELDGNLARDVENEYPLLSLYYRERSARYRDEAVRAERALHHVRGKQAALTAEALSAKMMQ